MTMTNQETAILDLLGKVLPQMTPLELEKLLAFGEGMAFMRGVKAEPEAEKSA